MNATTIALTQTVIYWTLLGSLVVWIIIFTIMAFRPEAPKNVYEEEEVIPVSRPLPGPAPVSSMATTAPRLQAVNTQQRQAVGVTVARSEA